MISEISGGIIYHTIYYTQNFTPVGGIHSERHFLDAIDADVNNLMNDRNVHGIIVEIHQTNSPCANCQPFIDDWINNIRQVSNTPITIRANATTIWAAAPGKLGDALHQYRGAANADNPGLNQALDDPGVTGIHLQLPSENPKRVQQTQDRDSRAKNRITYGDKTKKKVKK